MSSFKTDRIRLVFLANVLKYGSLSLSNVKAKNVFEQEFINRSDELIALHESLKAYKTDLMLTAAYDNSIDLYTTISFLLEVFEKDGDLELAAEIVRFANQNQIEINVRGLRDTYEDCVTGDCVPELMLLVHSTEKVESPILDNDETKRNNPLVGNLV